MPLKTINMLICLMHCGYNFQPSIVLHFLLRTLFWCVNGYRPKLSLVFKKFEEKKIRMRKKERKFRKIIKIIFYFVVHKKLKENIKFMRQVLFLNFLYFFSRKIEGGREGGFVVFSFFFSFLFFLLLPFFPKNEKIIFLNTPFLFFGILRNKHMNINYTFTLIKYLFVLYMYPKFLFDLIK